MSALAARQSVRYANLKGRRVAVVDRDDWEAMLDALEDMDDALTPKKILGDLEKQNFDFKKAGGFCA